MSSIWKNYNAKLSYDGYFTDENKLRKHAKIISSILEKYGNKKLQEIEKNCQSTISARGINFRVYAANNVAEDKKWPLDIIPRINLLKCSTMCYKVITCFTLIFLYFFNIIVSLFVIARNIQFLLL